MVSIVGLHPGGRLYYRGGSFVPAGGNTRVRTLLLLQGILVVAGCAGSSPSSPRAIVLYLRSALPRGGVSFGRVNPDRVDLGSLSPDPPTEPEDRSCGDVVAFAAGRGLADRLGLRDPFPVRSVRYRFWWYTGARRAHVALSGPGLDRPLAARSIEALDPPPEGPPRAGGYALLDLVVDSDTLLAPDQLDHLLLTLDAGNGAVKVATCPGRAATVILSSDDQPPPPPSTGTSEDCLPDIGALHDVIADSVPAVPETATRWANRSIADEVRLVGGSVRHDGHLVVSGALVLEGATLLLGAGDRPLARVDVLPGARLEIRDGSVVAAADRAAGFTIQVARGASLLVEDSEVRFGGAIRLQPDGWLEPRLAAFTVAAADARFVRTSFLHGLIALQLLGSGATVEDCRFVGNGTAILVDAPTFRVVGNTSIGDGAFLRLDHRASGGLVADNSIRYTIDLAVRFTPEATGVTLRDNRILDANAGVDLSSAQGNHLVGNVVRTCRSMALYARQALEGNDFEGNRWSTSEAPACPLDRGPGARPPPG